MGCYIVAELGNNHNGSAQLARDMILVASKAGVDAVKFQLRDVDSHPEWDRPYDSEQSFGRTYLEHRRALELSRDAYCELADEAHAMDLDVGASIWDASSIEVAKGMMCDWVKAPSACITDDLVMRTLEVASRSGLPIVLSLGMSTEAEIVHAVEGYDWPSGDALTLLHCTSAYPCDSVDAHLSVLGELRQRWGHRARIGVSGHWRGIHLDSVAVALGARFLERHITLDRSAKGTDHAAALEPRGLEVLVRNIRDQEKAMGVPHLQRLPCEEPARAKLRRAS